MKNQNANPELQRFNNVSTYCSWVHQSCRAAYDTFLVNMVFLLWKGWGFTLYITISAEFLYYHA